MTGKSALIDGGWLRITYHGISRLVWGWNGQELMMEVGVRRGRRGGGGRTGWTDSEEDVT